jgi:hypothetical protein
VLGGTWDCAGEHPITSATKAATPQKRRFGINFWTFKDLFHFSISDCIFRLPLSFALLQDLQSLMGGRRDTCNLKNGLGIVTQARFVGDLMKMIGYIIL